MRSPTLLVAGLLALAPVAVHAETVDDFLRSALEAYRRGDMESAKRDFELVRELDIKNQTAITYLRNIRLAESKSPQPAALKARLGAVVLPKVELQSTSFSTALEYLKQQAAKQTDGKTKLSFVMQVPEETAAKQVTLSLADVPLTEALRYLGDLANVTFSYEPYAVVVKPRASAAQPAQAATTQAQGQPEPQPLPPGPIKP